jgi:hypothetical protein
VSATTGGIGSDPDPHPDAEQLALLAMDAETEAGVKAHVAQCAACDRDLSVVRSLLESEGPDGADGRERAPVRSQQDVGSPPPPAADTAMADGNDDADVEIRQNLPPKEARKQAERLLAAQRSPRQGRQTLTVILVVVVAMLLVGLLALR